MAMQGVDKLLARQRELEAEINALRQESRRAALVEIHSLLRLHGLSIQEVVGSKRAPPKPPGKQGVRSVPPKYRSDSGQTWSGRGLTPTWLKLALQEGRSREDFEIKV